jgi:hypothetical protein
MFGYKRQKDILDRLKSLETKTEEIYHYMRSDMADVQEDLAELNMMMLKLDIPELIATMTYFNDSTNYIAKLLETAVRDDEPKDNVNGSH